MKRRDSLKALALSTLGVATPLKADPSVNNEFLKEKGEPTDCKDGRTPDEQKRDTKLQAEKFFTPHELKTVTILCDIIVPADAISGSASQAGVPAFIEFMMKDQPNNQVPMRGGLRWLDNQCMKFYEKKFVDCSSTQRIEMVDRIAYPELAKKEFSQGVSFFNLMRNLTLTGFYTTEMGYKDVGYMGNTPNNWEGVPADVLAQYGVSYD
ncbi:MAG: gluconate 2-dehydrogenase subunit 3 family protein [Saprospiraceae bacterium]|nr:gluconate 2-dehydrogenase subunit 3 family protein [Saprospiraceae bacterium]